MATLNEAPEQLRQWIKELDGQICMLNEQRDMLTSVLGVLDGSAFAEPVVEAPKPPLAKGMPARLKKAAAAKPKAKPRESKYDYAEIARVAAAAVRGGISATTAVAQRFTISGNMADQLIYRARKLGHDIPKSTTKSARPSNVTPITSSDANVAERPMASRAFTPDDTLRSSKVAEFDLRLFMDNVPWQTDANCRGLDTRLFFPERGELTRFAKGVCHACDVQAECLAYALNNDEKFGIWGGKSERERRVIRRRRKVLATGPIRRPGALEASA